MTWQERLRSPRTHATIAAAIAIGLAAAAAFWRVSMKPQQEIYRMRLETVGDLSRLYALQLSYKKAHGTFAGDLDALTAGAPDGAAIKAQLKANVDPSTLVIAGDAERFKIEVNVRDAERTLIKIKGPVTNESRPSGPAGPAPSPPPNADGAPISPATR